MRQLNKEFLSLRQSLMNKSLLFLGRYNAVRFVKYYKIASAAFFIYFGELGPMFLNKPRNVYLALLFEFYFKLNFVVSLCITHTK